MIINRKSDRIVVEFVIGDETITAHFVPLTVGTKAALSARVAPFVKYAGQDAASVQAQFFKADGTLDIDTPEKQQAFQEIMQCKTDIEVFTRETVKETLREIHGLKDNDGKDYVLNLGSDGKPTDICLDEIMGCEELVSGVTRIGQLMLHGIPREGQVLDPVSGKPIPGIIVKKSLKARSN
jgi:hypothetical protein